MRYLCTQDWGIPELWHQGHHLALELGPCPGNRAPHTIGIGQPHITRIPILGDWGTPILQDQGTPLQETGTPPHPWDTPRPWNWCHRNVTPPYPGAWEMGIPWNWGTLHNGNRTFSHLCVPQGGRTWNSGTPVPWEWGTLTFLGFLYSGMGSPAYSRIGVPPHHGTTTPPHPRDPLGFSLRFEVSLYHGDMVPPYCRAPGDPQKRIPLPSAIPGGLLRTSYSDQRLLLGELGGSHLWGEPRAEGCPEDPGGQGGFGGPAPPPRPLPPSPRWEDPAGGKRGVRERTGVIRGHPEGDSLLPPWQGSRLTPTPSAPLLILGTHTHSQGHDGTTLVPSHSPSHSPQGGTPKFPCAPRPAAIAGSFGKGKRKRKG